VVQLVQFYDLPALKNGEYHSGLRNRGIQQLPNPLSILYLQTRLPMNRAFSDLDTVSTQIQWFYPDIFVPLWNGVFIICPSITSLKDS